MKLNTNIDAASSRIITLAGVQHFVPVLVMRQNREVIPALETLKPFLARVNALAAANDSAWTSVFGPEEFDLAVRVVHRALTRAYPDATLDEVLDMPITNLELLEAIGTISTQTGFYIVAKGASAGEDEGQPAAP